MIYFIQDDYLCGGIIIDTLCCILIYCVVGLELHNSSGILRFGWIVGFLMYMYILVIVDPIRLLKTLQTHYIDTR